MNITVSAVVNNLFDCIKMRENLTTDAALARYIGVSNMAISRWRKGKFPLSLRIITPLLLHYKSDNEDAILNTDK